MLTSLNKLDASAVQKNLSVLQQLVTELSPDISVDSGPTHDTVLYPAAIIQTAIQKETYDVLNDSNLQQIAEDPAALSVEQLDEVAANWFITRKQGMVANGHVYITARDSSGFVLPAGTEFTVNNIKLKTKSTFQISNRRPQTDTHDKQLVETINCDWITKIPVTAMAIGHITNIRRGTQLQFNRSQFPMIKTVTAADDLINGRSAETNAQLIKRLQHGGNNNTITSLLMQQDAIHVTHVSIIGCDDKELLRDTLNTWPGHVGGVVDIYIKTAAGILSKEINLTGKRTNTPTQGSSTSIWELNIGNEAAAGLYYVNAVHIKGRRCHVKQEKRLGLNSASRDVAYSSQQYVKLIVEANDAFTWDNTNNFVVDMRYMAGLAQLQEAVNNSPVIGLTSNVLLKAAVPCVTTIQVELQQTGKVQPVEITKLKTMLASAINDTGFIGKLSMPVLVGLLSPHLPIHTVITALTIAGRIRCPDSHIITLEPSTLLEIPTEIEHLVSPKTVVFFQDPEDITINVVTVDED